MITLPNIKQEAENCGQITLDCNPVFAGTQKDIINLIDLYYVNRYRDGDYDSTGFKKAFYNVVVNPTEIASKMVDLDTKDIRIIAENGQSYYPAWLFEKELKLWMKDKKNEDGKTFGQFLNQIVYSWPKYGHVLVKKVKDTVHLVPLQNVSVEPDAKNFMSSEYLIEEHSYTPEQLRALRAKNWKNIENAIRKFEKDGKIAVYERHGFLRGTKDNYVIIPVGGKEEDILYRARIDRKDIYRELKWEDIPGRALGRGQVEKLFEAQIAKNQNENLLRSGYRWTSKHIFQSRDDTIAKNFVTETEDGDVITVNSEITPIAVEERNLGALNVGDQKWDKNISDMTFSYEPLAGQRPPSGTPLGTSILQTRMAGQFYDLKREDLGMFIKEILFDWIIPEFKKQKRNEHSLMLGEFDEDELDNLRGLILTNRTNKAILDFIGRNKRVPSSDEAEVLKVITQERLKTQKEAKIPKGYYDNLKYKIDIVITNEQIDMASRMTTLQTVLQIIGANPTILQDKRTKKVFYKLLDLAGISPLDFQTEAEPQINEIMANQVAQRGGSVARVPTPIATPETTITPRTL